jgi:ParB family chromosome partitioning protein
MARAKLSFSAPITVPLDCLERSEGNVRRIRPAIPIQSLADSIARRGLLQSLSVRPVLDDAGAETGRYRVQAGSRRLEALQLLMKQKRLAKNASIPCLVKTSGLEEEDSLAENTDREALHPLDQFRAFAALAEKGQGIEDIAASFSVTPAVVRQRKEAGFRPRITSAGFSPKTPSPPVMRACALWASRPMKRRAALSCATSSKRTGAVI